MVGNRPEAVPELVAGVKADLGRVIRQLDLAASLSKVRVDVATTRTEIAASLNITPAEALNEKNTDPEVRLKKAEPLLTRAQAAMRAAPPSVVAARVSSRSGWKRSATSPAIPSTSSPPP